MLAHALMAAWVLAAAPPVPVVAPVLPVFPTGTTQTLNIIQWEGNKLPPIYERSNQLPLTDGEIAKLSSAGFTAPQLVKMIEERRCACDASADGLIALKKQGVAPEVIQAVSLHGLRPNRELELLVTLDFTGESRVARENFLYVFVEDGALTRVLTLNLGDLLSRTSAHDTQVDRSDLLIARTVRRIQLAGLVPLTTYGQHAVMVATSARPTLSHPSELLPQERKKAQVYSIDYPRASLQSLCRLTAGYKRDAVLAYQWHFQGSRFECEWN